MSKPNHAALFFESAAACSAEAADLLAGDHVTREDRLYAARLRAQAARFEKVGEALAARELSS